MKEQRLEDILQEFDFEPDQDLQITTDEIKNLLHRAFEAGERSGRYNDDEFINKIKPEIEGNARKQTARKILDEIEKAMPSHNSVWQTLAELKRKYLKGENND